jgi:hypothetical protein
MARSFGKQKYEWLRLASTVSFLEALTATGKSRNADNLIVTRVAKLMEVVEPG